LINEERLGRIKDVAELPDSGQDSAALGLPIRTIRYAYRLRSRDVSVASLMPCQSQGGHE
jgi:hypothetical protein